MSSGFESRHPIAPMLRAAIRDCTIVCALAGFAVALAQRSSARPLTTHEPYRIVIASKEPRPSPAPAGVLRVCADPNNLPFSNDRREGFENAIADLVANDLGDHADYFWQPQRRGFIRTTLNAGWCDLVIGVPAGFEMARTTRPYYRSTYVFVSRLERTLPIRSLDDPRLRHVQVGVEMTGEDAENPPAVQALAERHIIDNMRGFLVYGDYSKPDPPRGIIDAVAAGDVDTAIAWGPLAGYFAARAPVPLRIAPVTPQHAGPGLAFTYEIAMAVRRSDTALHDAIDRIIDRRAADIERILKSYDVPLLPMEGRS